MMTKIMGYVFGIYI